MSWWQSVWHKYLGGKSKPWADTFYDIESKVVKCRSFNAAFVKKARAELGTVADDKDDLRVVRVYFDRQNIEHEEPRLDVLHTGIDEDGRVKMKLDWNKAFIRHLPRTESRPKRTKKPYRSTWPA